MHPVGADVDVAAIAGSQFQAGWVREEFAQLLAIWTRNGKKDGWCERIGALQKRLRGIDHDRRGAVRQVGIKVPPFKDAGPCIAPKAICPACWLWTQPLLGQKFRAFGKNHVFGHSAYPFTRLRIQS
jgi:hypothetical protein